MYSRYINPKLIIRYIPVRDDNIILSRIAKDKLLEYCIFKINGDHLDRLLDIVHNSDPEFIDYLFNKSFDYRLNQMILAKGYLSDILLQEIKIVSIFKHDLFHQLIKYNCRFDTVHLHLLFLSKSYNLLRYIEYFDFDYVNTYLIDDNQDIYPLLKQCIRRSIKIKLRVRYLLKVLEDVRYLKIFNHDCVSFYHSDPSEEFVLSRLTEFNLIKVKEKL